MRSKSFPILIGVDFRIENWVSIIGKKLAKFWKMSVPELGQISFIRQIIAT